MLGLPSAGVPHDVPCSLSVCSLSTRLTRSQVLELASERVFVPLTVGGGIRSHTDDTGKVGRWVVMSTYPRS